MGDALNHIKQLAQRARRTYPELPARISEGWI
jgi:hypothetical protein